MKCKLVSGTKENLKATVEKLGIRGKMDLKPVIETVQQVIDNIRDNGDKALLGYTEKFDGVKLEASEIRVTDEEIAAAKASIDPELMGVMERAAANIRAFHEKQKEEGFMTDVYSGAKVGVRVRPISIAGVYVPGGTAPLPSTVLMDVIPASVAGVGRIVFATPPRKDGTIAPVILAAASIAGATEIYKMGGAQAIAAMAYGTETIPKVDKITGPGNIFVALAKKACFGVTGIDSVAGPSEILIIADSTANPRYVAADLLSQAEHDPMASAILLTTDENIAKAVSEEIDGFLKTLSRAEIIQKSLDDYGYIFVGDTMEDLVEAANTIASEHLEIITENPYEVMTKIRNAGAIFLGSYSSEPLGDYFAGPNHILPTNGTARFFSPLGVDDFVKKSSIISYSKDALRAVHKDIELFALSEGLTAHANSIAVRFEEEE